MCIDLIPYIPTTSYLVVCRSQCEQSKHLPQFSLLLRVYQIPSRHRRGDVMNTRCMAWHLTRRHRSSYLSHSRSSNLQISTRSTVPIKSKTREDRSITCAHLSNQAPEHSTSTNQPKRELGWDCTSAASERWLNLPYHPKPRW